MGKDRDQDAGGGFDVRILSLCSRGIGSGIPVNFSEENGFYSFYYYDAIKVRSVSLSDCAQLKDAYYTACSMRKESPPVEIPQSIVAITDVSSQPGTPGYTRERIESFWKDNTAPIFFVSMINLSRPADLEQILRLIGEKFHAEPHLAYLTFDHCDIIIFGRGDSFERYTSCIFDLCYTGACTPEDIITVYGFSPQKALYNQPEREVFTSCIRLGIRDYSELDRLAPKCGDGSNARRLLGKEISVSWLLGRNDVNLYCPSASLPWLREVRNALIESADDNPWYTTYDLMVLIEEGHHKWQSPDRFPRNLSALKKKMDSLYQAFEDAYTDQYERLTATGDIYYPDQVWCRWLNESSRLAVSLIGNPLSSDFGTCLVPQFLDLLEYGYRLFRNDGRLLSQSEIEEAHESFSEFFSNTAILVDSLNQTNRQFVQVPAFHLPSFEVPSQIMAYYTAMAYRILNVLWDKEDYFYGLSISPKLVNSLGVSSLALLSVLENDEWLSISMDEESFYTLKLTTETLGHEISHFVGEGNRNREKRKDCILRWAFHELVSAWYLELSDRIPKQFCPPGRQAVRPTEFPSFNALSGAARALFDLAQETEEEYSSTWRNQRNYVLDLILQITQDIDKNPQLKEEAFRQIWMLLNEEEGRVLKEQVRSYVLWEIGLDSASEQACSAEAREWTVNKLVQDKLKTLFSTVLDDIARLFSDKQYQNNMQLNMLERFEDQVCCQFGETFADLQAILLLGMKWNDYYMLLKRDENRELMPDCPPRMLAVTRVLIDCRVWDPEKDPESFSRGGGDFDAVKELAFSPSEEFISRLCGSEFDRTLIYYLTEYLKDCVDSIQAYFGNASRKEYIDEIRKMYLTLAAPPSMLGLQKAILEFVKSYQTQCLSVE